MLRLHRLCDAAEMLVRFLATAALGEIVASKGDDLPDAVQSVLLDCLERPTLGQWIAILRTACRALPPEPVALVPEIGPLAEQLMDVMGGDGRPLERSVVALRNALAHRRLPADQAEALLNAHRTRFEDLWTGPGATFLGEIELVGVTESGGLVLLRGDPGRPGEFPAAALPAAAPRRPGAILLTRPGSDRWHDLYPLHVFGHVLRRDGPVTAEPVSQVYARLDEVPHYIALHPREGYGDGTAEMRDALEALFPLSAWRRARRESEETRIADAELRGTVRPFRFRDVIESALREPFVGRDADLAAALGWLDRRREGIGVVLAGPGMGKTAFATHLVAAIRQGRKRSLCLPHFFKVDDDRCSTRRFMTGVLLRLEVEGLPHVELPGPEGAAFEAFLDALDSFAGEHLGPARPHDRLVLLLDGMDEIAARDPRLIDIVRARRIERVAWLCLGRPDPVVEAGLPASIAERVFGADGLAPLDRSAVRQYLVDQLERGRYHYLSAEDADGGSRLLDFLVESGRNLPLYLRLLAADLRSGVFRADRPEALPASLEAYYDDLLRRLPLDDARSVVPAVVGLLAAALTPLTAPMLSALLADHELRRDPDWPRILDAALDAARPLMRAAFLWNDASGHTLYHESFRRYLLERADESYREFRLAASVRRARERVLALCRGWTALDPGTDARRYALSHGVAHLIAAGDASGLDGAARGGIFRAIADEVSAVDALEAARRAAEFFAARSGDSSQSHDALARCARAYAEALDRIAGDAATLIRLAERGETRRLLAILEGEPSAVRRSVLGLAVSPLLERSGHVDLAVSLRGAAHAVLRPAPPAPRGADGSPALPVEPAASEALARGAIKRVRDELGPVTACLAVALTNPREPWATDHRAGRESGHALWDRWVEEASGKPARLPWAFRVLAAVGSRALGFTLAGWALGIFAYGAIAEKLGIAASLPVDAVYTLNRVLIAVLVAYALARLALRGLRAQTDMAAVRFVAALESKEPEIRRAGWRAVTRFVLCAQGREGANQLVALAVLRELRREQDPAAAARLLRQATLLCGAYDLIHTLREANPGWLRATLRELARLPAGRYDPRGLLYAVAGSADRLDDPDLLVELMDRELRWVGRVGFAETAGALGRAPAPLLARALLQSVERARRARSRRSGVGRQVDRLELWIGGALGPGRAVRAFWLVVIGHFAVAYLLGIPLLLWAIPMFTLAGVGAGRVWDSYRLVPCRREGDPAAAAACAVDALETARMLPPPRVRPPAALTREVHRVVGSVIAQQILARGRVDPDIASASHLRSVLRRLARARLLDADARLVLAVMGDRALLDAVLGLRRLRRSGGATRHLTQADHTAQMGRVLPVASALSDFGLAVGVGGAAAIAWWAFELLAGPPVLRPYLVELGLAQVLGVVLGLAALQHAHFAMRQAPSVPYRLGVGFVGVAGSVMTGSFLAELTPLKDTLLRDPVLPFVPIAIACFLAPEVIARWRGAALLYPSAARLRVERVLCAVWLAGAAVGLVLVHRVVDELRGALG